MVLMRISYIWYLLKLVLVYLHLNCVYCYVNI